MNQLVAETRKSVGEKIFIEILVGETFPIGVKY